MNLQVGSIAPSFLLQDQDGAMHSLEHYKGKWVLVYFYPRDNTPGCTKEACDIRDGWHAFQQHNVVVLGISTDTVKSHKRFAKKYQLPFTLLADINKEVVNKYEVWRKKKFMGREYMGIYRSSFLINPAGKIAKIYEGVNPAHHVAEVTKDLEDLLGSRSSV